MTCIQTPLERLRLDVFLLCIILLIFIQPQSMKSYLGQLWIIVVILLENTAAYFCIFYFSFVVLLHICYASMWKPLLYSETILCLNHLSDCQFSWSLFKEWQQALEVKKYCVNMDSNISNSPASNQNCLRVIWRINCPPWINITHAVTEE